MKFTPQSTFVLITILAFLGVSVYTSNLNYLIAGGFFAFFFAPNKTEK